ncbi:tachykinin-like peptides receptor 86C [Parasteatoda tepidariorum]|uniref:tachykinin-like peptides receptor 86C n=1 Tax=Parasteatoda tepidariorum TaxID=114398 RepID=UPI001C719ED9|nr:tachykinin-like peptides receptor 86C [Parasteatoda tepidariorum]
MGNLQPKEIDLLEAYMDSTTEEILYSNASGCKEIYNALLSENLTTMHEMEVDPEYSALNYSEIYLRCFNNTIPSSIFNQPYILPWYQQFLWTMVFAIMIIVAIVGNVIVMWIIMAHRRMRTVTNFFLLNLAIADFLLASGNATFNFVFMLNSHWPFGGTFCIISNFLASLTVSTSVFTILAMSLDRFVAVTHPLRPRMTKTLALIIIFSIWTLSSLLSIPSILYATTITYKYADQGQRTLCYLVWPDNTSGKSYADHVYNIIFLLVTYVIPMCCMAVTYTWIGCILWRSKVIGENSDPQNNVIKSKQRVVHMLVAIMLLFAICWLPYHIYFLYTYYNSEVLQTHVIQHVYLAIYWLAMSNSCYNPIVYYIMNARFRNYFREVMCPCKKPSKSPGTSGYAKNGNSYPLLPRASIYTSHRTRSTRIINNHIMRESDLNKTIKEETNHLESC